MAAQQKNENVPRTANLLACKQWWKVCFLHGNQEKYYRQIYGQAAAQRMKEAANEKNLNLPNKIVYPTKSHSPVIIDSGSGDTFKLNNSPKNRKQKVYSKNADPEWILPKSTVNILDDPFLFGIDHIENGSDSGIDANCTNKSSCTSTPNRLDLSPTNQTDYSIVSPPPRPPKSTKILNSQLNYSQQHEKSLDNE